MKITHKPETILGIELELRVIDLYLIIVFIVGMFVGYILGVLV